MGIGKEGREPGAMSSASPAPPPTPVDWENDTMAAITPTLGCEESGMKKGMRVTPSSVVVLIAEDFSIVSAMCEELMLTIAMMEGGEERLEEGRDGAGGEGRRRAFVGRFLPSSPFQDFVLGDDAMRVAMEPNAGGASTISESLSMEYFARRFRATNVVTEMEVSYTSRHWKKVDFICDIYGRRVGVSVTRAMSYPNPEAFSEADARRLLVKKLFGLVVAREGVSPQHSFMASVLHVWCETRRAAQMLQELYPSVAAELEVAEDVIMVLTIAEGMPARPIFYESELKSPKGRQPPAELASPRDDSSAAATNCPWNKATWKRDLPRPT